MWVTDPLKELGKGWANIGHAENVRSVIIRQSVKNELEREKERLAGLRQSFYAKCGVKDTSHNNYELNEANTLLNALVDSTNRVTQIREVSKTIDNLGFETKHSKWIANDSSPGNNAVMPNSNPFNENQSVGTTHSENNPYNVVYKGG